MAKPKKRDAGLKKLSSAQFDVAQFFSNSLESKYKALDKVVPYKDFFLEAFQVLEPSTRYKHNWHIDYLCDILDKEARRVAAGEPKEKDYVINMMFRSLKSYIFTIIFNAWVWSFAPWLRFATASYAHSLSIEHSNKTRTLIKSQFYQSNFRDVFEIIKSQDSKEYFGNNMGGERKAVSVGGQFTGSGGNFLIIDDPVKPPSKNTIGFKESDIIDSNSWYSGTAYSRLNDPEVDLRIILMQRVHNNDLSGYVLASENGHKYEHICIPGEMKDNLKPVWLKKYYLPDLKTGRLLFFRDRFSSEKLEEYKGELKDNYHGQVNQKPTSEKGGKWKEDMFYMIDDKDIPDSNFSIELTGWDLATTLKTEGSSSAFVKGLVKNNCLYITDTGYDWLEYPDLVRWIKQVGGTAYIENKSSGLQAVPHLKSENFPAEDYNNNNMDKFAHTKTATFHAKDMTIFIAKSIWDKLLFDQVNGICEFPNSTKDDVNDAFNILICTASEFIVKNLQGSSESINSTLEKIMESAEEEIDDYGFNGSKDSGLWNYSL